MALAADEREDQEVATDAKVPPDQLSRWKNGRAVPKLDNVTALVETLGISGHWLLTGEGDMRPADPDEAVVKLAVIGRVADGTLDDAVVRALAKAPTPATPEDWAETILEAVRAARRTAGPTTKAR